MPNLLELIEPMITPDTISKLTSLTGESSDGVTKALAAVVPTLIAGAAAKGSTPAGAQQLINSMGSLTNATNVTSQLGGGDATQNLLSTGGSLASSLFGSNAGQITNLLSSATGVGGKSITSLLAVGAPLVASVIGKTLGAGNVNPTSVSNLLAEQGQYVKDLVPAGVNSLLSTTTTTTRPPVAEPAPARVVTEPAPRAETYTAPTAPASTPVATAAPKRSVWTWLLPLLGILALLLLAYFLFFQPRPTVNNTAVCNGLAQLEQTVGSGPTITAETSVADVKAYYDRVRGVYNTTSTAAQSLTGVNLSGLTNAFNTLESAINSLTGETVGDAAATLNSAIDGVKTQYTTLKTNIGCT